MAIPARLSVLGLLVAASMTAQAQIRRPGIPVYRPPLVQQPGISQTAEWAAKMVSTKKVDFGVIATGSESRRIIKIKNNRQETVRIGSVGTTCGCSVAVPSKKILAPGEEAEVVITMNTFKFQRRKDSNVLITMSKGPINSPSTVVRVPVTAYIRTDVVFKPGMVNFGPTEYQKGAKRTVAISYAGRQNWRIKKVLVQNKHLMAQVRETRRGGGLVDYVLDVTLKPSAPVGRMRDLVTLITDDANNPNVPLLVEATVEPDISVTPSIVNLGRLSPGQTRVSRVIVKGKKPFEIDKIVAAAANGSVKYKRPTNKSTLLIVPITLKAPSKTGRVDEQVDIWIAGRAEPVRFRITADVEVRGVIGSR